jgi:hypothetical protein
MRFVLLALVVVILDGCGSAGVSQEAAVVQTAKTYLSDAANGNGQGACDQMTSSQQRNVVRNASATGAQTCAAVMTEVAARLTETDKSHIRGATISDVRIKGDAATAMIARGGIRQFVRINRRWLLSG